MDHADASPDEAASVTGTRLTGRTPRHALPVGGAGAMLFGLPFAGAGVAIICIATGVIEVDPASIKVPRWVLGMVGLIFALPGLGIILAGGLALRSRRRADQLRASHPHEYWLADYNWDQEGASDQPWRNTIAATGAALFMTVFLVPFNYFVFIEGKAPTFAKVFIGLFDLILLALIGGAIYSLLRTLKYGRSRVRFDRFPFLLGQSCDLHFVPGRNLRAFDRISFTLRCIEARTVTRRTSKGTSSSVVCFELWSDAFEVNDPGQLSDIAGVPLTFLLPGEPGLATDMGAGGRKSRYWELDVVAVTPGIDYKTTFLIPVYAEPSRD